MDKYLDTTICPNCNLEKTIRFWHFPLGKKIKCKHCKQKFEFKWYKFFGGFSCGIVGEYTPSQRPKLPDGLIGETD